MADAGRLRRTIYSLFLWGVFFCLYAGGAAILTLGLIFTSKTWRSAVDQHADRWTIFIKTGEVLFLGAGLLFIMIIPFLGYRRFRKLAPWKNKRRQGTKRKEFPSA